MPRRVDQVRHVAEPILLVAHADKHALIDIDKRVTIDYDDRHAELRSSNGPTCCFKKIAIDKGEIDHGFRTCRFRD